MGEEKTIVQRDPGNESSLHCGASMSRKGLKSRKKKTEEEGIDGYHEME